MSKNLLFPTIDFNSYKLKELTNITKEQLHNEGLLIIKNFPNNNRIITDFSYYFGEPSLSGIKKNNTDEVVESEFIRRIELTDQPIKNSIGKRVLSSTSDFFALHTDEYYELNPSKYLILLCVIPDKYKGGKTIISDIREVVKKLPHETIIYLQKNIFPHPAKEISILSSEMKKFYIRYNRYAIESALATTHKNIKIKHEHLNTFDHQLTKCSKSILLSKEDCLILDNKRILHGRTSFFKNSKRFLKRIRIIENKT